MTGGGHAGTHSLTPTGALGCDDLSANDRISWNMSRGSCSGGVLAFRLRSGIGQKVIDDGGGCDGSEFLVAIQFHEPRVEDRDELADVRVFVLHHDLRHSTGGRLGGCRIHAKLGGAMICLRSRTQDSERASLIV